MIDKNKLPKAYKEVYEILKYIPEEDYKKIPKSMIKVIKKGMDKSYDFKVTEFEDFQKQEMLSETECILAIFYRDYWASEKERNRILMSEEQDRINTYKIRYKDIKNQVDRVQPAWDENNSIIAVKDSFFTKIIQKIKDFFKLN
jgi:hypothetical protein